MLYIKCDYSISLTKTTHQQKQVMPNLNFSTNLKEEGKI